MTPRAWTPLVLTVAPNGARRTKADHPALPLTPAELADTAADCLEAGAAMIHLHVRDAAGRHSLDPDTYRAAIDAIRRRVGQRLVIQVTTEAAGRFGPETQMGLVRALHPEAVSLAPRELVPDEAHEASAARFLAWVVSEGIMPQFILYSADDARRYQALCERGVVPPGGHFLLFVLGRYAGAQAAEPRELLPLLAACPDARDGGAPWAVCAFGPREHACGVAAAALGGHVRVGFENNLALKDGRTAPSNAALVAQMREAAGALGRPLADADEVRAWCAR